MMTFLVLLISICSISKYHPSLVELLKGGGKTQKSVKETEKINVSYYNKKSGEEWKNTRSPCPQPGLDVKTLVW